MAEEKIAKSASLPSAAWFRAMDRVIGLAERTAAAKGFALVIDRSKTSEARYLHVLRGETWYGIRIASHFPFYACSRDYFQVLLDDPPSAAAEDYSCRQVIDLVTGGGRVVADPVALAEEIRRRTDASLLAPGVAAFGHRQAAVLRHRMNQREKWSYDETLKPAAANR